MSTDRFVPAVDSALRAAGWFPGRRLAPEVVRSMQAAIAASTGRYGGRLPDVSFAEPVLAEFGGLVVDPRQSGVDLSPRRFILDPGLARHYTETLIDAGRALGVRLCPVGIEGAHEAVLAVTDRGSLIAIDPIGDWLLGNTIDEALDLLVTGRPPDPATLDNDPQKSVVDSHGGAAFFLPRTPANLPYVWLPDVLVRIGIVPAASAGDPGRFWVTDWGGVPCEVHVLDLERHTVLVLTFQGRPVLEAQPPAELPDSLPALSPVARAFRIACAALTPELEAAFVRTERTPDVLRLLAEPEPAVVTREAKALLDTRFELVYLGDRAGFQIDQPPARAPRDELPIGDGRLFLAPTDPQPAR